MIFSFLTGEMHEGFSIPAGVLCCIALPCAGEDSPARNGVCRCHSQQVPLTSIFAPGNFLRISLHRAAEGSLLNTFEQLPALIWFPAVFLIIFLFHNSKGHLKEFLSQPLMRFLIVMAATSLVFNLF